MRYYTAAVGWTALLAALSLAQPGAPLGRAVVADTAFRWSAGSRVRTYNGGDASITGVFVRADSTATSTVLATIPLAVKGTLLSIRPFLAADGGQRWKVAWDGFPTGWSRQIYLALDSTAPPPPPPPPPTVAIVRIDGFLTGGLTLALGATHQFQAIAVDASGTVVPTVFTWRAAAPAIAPVDATGLVTARSAGIGLDTVSATAPNGVRAWFLVNVSPAPPPPSPLAWGGRALSLDALKFARPPCLINWTAGVTTVCGPYARLDDSTGAVLQHFTVTFTISP